ncbi:MAG: hypothetical protein GF401_02180 [Chitinivibrionales bacterium]|nr:hypothetical protein [Chitinivibrionales bacterium]
MIKRIMFPITFLLLVIGNTHAADLEKNELVDTFLNSCSTTKLPLSADLTSFGIRNAERVTERPVAYKVKKTPYSENRLLEISAIVNCASSGEVKTRGACTIVENADNSVRTGYDEQRGRYFYYNSTTEKKPLANTGKTELSALKAEAQKYLNELLGNDAGNFVFANTETDCVQVRGDAIPVISKQSYRFTRKVNGRHIIDNTAFFKATFAGNQELCAMEFSNPVLEPVQIKTMVKPGVTGERLTKWAENKENAVAPPNNKIKVNRVSSLKPVESYLAMTEGEEVYIVPHVSFWSELNLDNGDSYRRFIHLCMDAQRTPNLDEAMIENTGR